MPNETNLILDGANLVIMPIRKAGCLSITTACQSLNDHPTIKVLSRNNSHVAEYKRKGYMVATFVRNPYDRFVSFYEHMVNGDHPNPALWPLGFEHHMPFESAAELVASIPDHEADVHFMGQVSAVSLNSMFLPPWVGYFDKLEQAWNDLRDYSGINLPPLPHRNKSERRPWRDYYSDRTRNLIHERYAADFACFWHSKWDEPLSEWEESA